MEDYVSEHYERLVIILKRHMSYLAKDFGSLGRELDVEENAHIVVLKLLRTAPPPIYWTVN